MPDDSNPTNKSEFFVFESKSSAMRAYIEMRIQGYSQTEIATMLGCSYRTVTRYANILKESFRDSGENPNVPPLYEVVYKDKPSSLPASELVLEFDIPEGFSDEEVVEAIQRLTLGANDLHRALGGNGLKINQLHIDAEIPVEVSIG